MTKRFTVLIWSLLLLSYGAIAQTASLSGKITSKGEGLAGAAVQLKGTSQGTIADANGQFKITGIPAGKALTVSVSFVGYEATEQTLTLKAGETRTLNIELAEGSRFLEDVIVTGLSVNAKQKELGTARSGVNAETIESLPNVTIEDAMVGRMAGVEAFTTDGAPGGGYRFRIRGGNSILGASEPLVIVDGIIMDNSNRNTTSGSVGGNNATGSASFGMNNGTRGMLAVNPEDIESIEVLKGAAAASLYGSRASSGVIVIKTKSGGNGRLSLDYSLDAGTSAPARGVLTYKTDWTTAEIDQWTGFRNAAGLNPAYTAAEIAKFKLNPQTDWLKGGLQTGSFTRHTLRLTGGSKLLGVYASVSTQDNTGHVKGTKFSADGFRFSLSSEPVAGLTLKATVDYSDDKRSILPGGSPGFFVPNAWARESTVMPFMTLGDFAATNSPSRAINIFFGIQGPDNYARIRKDLVSERALFTANLNYKILNNLSIDVNLGTDGSTIRSNTIYPFGLTTIFPTGRLDTDVEDIKQQTLTVGLNHAWQISEKMYLKSAVGSQYDKNERDYVYRRYQTKTTPTAPEADISSYTTELVGSFFQIEAPVNTLGLYFNETLGINEKLFVNVGGRFDRSSSFAEKFFFYPRASLSYSLTNKIRARAAYGSSGTQPPPFLVNQYFRREAGGYNGSGASLVVNNPANPNLKPETQTETEFGIDANLLNGRLNVELSYYNKQFEDLLLNAPVSPDVNSGAVSAIRNVGSMYNRGFEWSLSYDVLKTKHFSWNAAFVGATLDNKVTKMTSPPVPILGGDPSGSGITQIREGYPLGGLWATTTDSPTTQVYRGNTLAKVDASLNNVLQYKGFSIRALLGGKFGFKKFNGTSRYIADPSKRMHVDYWTLPTADLTRLVNTLDNWIQPADFVKLRQLSLGYTFPATVLKDSFIKKLTLTLSGTNLHTWSKYKGGYDVESETSGSGNQNAWVRGIDAWEAGMPKMWTFSMNVGF